MRVQRSRSSDRRASPPTALTSQPAAPAVRVAAIAGQAGRVAGSTCTPTASASAAMPTTWAIAATWPSTAVARGCPAITAASARAPATTAVVAVDHPSDGPRSVRRSRRPRPPATPDRSATRGTRARPTATASSAATWAPSLPASPPFGHDQGDDHSGLGQDPDRGPEVAQPDAGALRARRPRSSRRRARRGPRRGSRCSTRRPRQEREPEGADRGRPGAQTEVRLRPEEAVDRPGGADQRRR